MERKMTSWEMELKATVINNNLARFKSILARMEVKKNLGRSAWKFGEAPFHFAAYAGRDKMVLALIDAGCRIDSYVEMNCGYRCNVLTGAVLGERASTVILLLHLGADETARSKWEGTKGVFSGTALEWARREGVTEITKILERDEIEKELYKKLKRVASIKEEMSRLNEETKILCENIESSAAKLKNISLPHDVSESLKSCPVCFETAVQIFSCRMCKNWICSLCKARVATCPICREDFGAKPPRRDLGIERALGI